VFSWLGVDGSLQSGDEFPEGRIRECDRSTEQANSYRQADPVQSTGCVPLSVDMTDFNQTIRFPSLPVDNCNYLDTSLLKLDARLFAMRDQYIWTIISSRIAFACDQFSYDTSIDILSVGIDKEMLVIATPTTWSEVVYTKDSRIARFF